MENIKEAIVETLEDVNEVIAETAEDVKDFAVETMEDFKDAVIEAEVSLVKNVETSVSLEVGEILELAGSKLKEMKEEKMEEMVEEVKPRLRRETFENSFMLSRVGGRQFLLVLLIIAQVMMQIQMLMMQHKNAGADVHADNALCSDDRDPADAWPPLLPGRCSSCIAKACPCGGAWLGLAQVDPICPPP